MNDDKRKTAADEARELLKTFLHSRRMRCTMERDAILEAISAMSGLFTAEELCNALEEKSMHVSIATVYNTLDLFIEAGLLLRHRHDNSSAARFEWVPPVAANTKGTGPLLPGLDAPTPGRPSSKVLLVCSACGKVKIFTANTPIGAIASPKKIGTFSPQYYTTSIYGLCRICQKKERKKNRR